MESSEKVKFIGMNLQEVSYALRVHPNTVLKLVYEGLPARKVGREWRFNRESVLNWLDNKNPCKAKSL